MLLCWFLLNCAGELFDGKLFTPSVILLNLPLDSVLAATLHLLVGPKRTRLLAEIMSQNNAHQLTPVVGIVDTYHVYEHLLERVVASERYLLLGFVLVFGRVMGLMARHVEGGVLVLIRLTGFGGLTLLEAEVLCHLLMSLVLLLVLLTCGNVAFLGRWPTLLEGLMARRECLLCVSEWLVRRSE